MWSFDSMFLAMIALGMVAISIGFYLDPKHGQVGPRAHFTMRRRIVRRVHAWRMLLRRK